MPKIGHRLPLLLQTLTLRNNIVAVSFKVYFPSAVKVCNEFDLQDIVLLVRTMVSNSRLLNSGETICHK